MKKFLKATLFLCALSSLAYAEDAAPVVTSGTTMTAEEQKDAMDILERMRAKIEKEEAERARAEEQARIEAEKQAKEAEKRAQEDAEAQALFESSHGLSGDGYSLW